MADSGLKRRLGPRPITVKCPKCNQVVITETEVRKQHLNYLVAALFCCICCWPCAIYTCARGCFHEVDHYCPLCESPLGTYTQ